MTDYERGRQDERAKVVAQIETEIHAIMDWAIREKLCLTRESLRLCDERVNAYSYIRDKIADGTNLAPDTTESR